MRTVSGPLAITYKISMRRSKPDSEKRFIQTKKSGLLGWPTHNCHRLLEHVRT